MIIHRTGDGAAAGDRGQTPEDDHYTRQRACGQHRRDQHYLSEGFSIGELMPSRSSLFPFGVPPSGGVTIHDSQLTHCPLPTATSHNLFFTLSTSVPRMGYGISLLSISIGAYAGFSEWKRQRVGSSL